MQQYDFLGGVVEGFYGRPWTHEQRLQLFDLMARLGLNTYFYAPKDDLKHRAIWRELYNDSELALLRELAQACQQRGLMFIYGLAPGLDVRFSERAEVGRIEARFEQLQKVGVGHFALLFDDLPGQISDDDLRAYSSLAAAQCDVTNTLFAWVRAQSDAARFLFCPTPYCDRMDREQLGGAGYLDDVGQLLNPEIDVLWTGPEIISEEIPVDSIERLTQRLRRPPVIWDNLFANDYDLHRLHCGPYSGRTPDLHGAVRGILVNPNNEYPINSIPLSTLAAFLSGESNWQPREAFLAAAAEWLQCFETVSQPVLLEDLVLLADCFYLPHTEGPEAERLLKVIRKLLVQPADSLGHAREEFCDLNRRIQSLFIRLTELRDRELFHAWSRHGWSLKEGMQAIDAMLKRGQVRSDLVEGLELELGFSETRPGGLLTKLERLMELDACQARTQQA